MERFFEKIRNSIEGKFGEGKRCYRLNRIMAKLKETSESVIMLQFLVMNLEHKFRVLLFQIFKVLFFNVRMRPILILDENLKTFSVTPK